MWVSVDDGDERSGSLGWEKLVENRVGCVEQPLACLKGPENEIGRGGTRDVGGEAASIENIGCCDYLGHHCANADECDARGFVGHAEPVAAREHLPAAVFAKARMGRHFGGVLVERPSRESEIRRGPSRLPELGERMKQRPFEILCICGLPGGAAGLLQPDRGSHDRLMRTAFWRKRYARRSADENRLAAGVDAKGPRLQRTSNERVVQRSDRQERLTVT